MPRRRLLGKAFLAWHPHEGSISSKNEDPVFLRRQLHADRVPQIDRNLTGHLRDLRLGDLCRYDRTLLR